MKKGFLLTLFVPSILLALAIDEKLTCRVLNVSDSKKTVLINRGIEDGLEAGNHAKFFLTTGVVARGIVQKVSPTRSIWSFYRVISGDSVVPQKVLSLKISTPVQLTDDSSRMIQEEDRGDRLRLLSHGNIPLAHGAEDTRLARLNADTATKKDLKDLEDDYVKGGISLNRIWEIWSSFQVSSLGAVSNLGANGIEYSGNVSVLDFSLGLEKYFDNQKRWYGRLSFYPFLSRRVREIMVITGADVHTSLLEYGLGISYHLFNLPTIIYRPIGFITANGGIGKVNETITSPTGDSSVVTEYEGDLSFFAIGVGLKYYIPWGLGMRILIDYYQRAETYVIANQNNDFTKSVSGLRINLGLAWRF